MTNSNGRYAYLTLTQLRALRHAALTPDRSVLGGIPSVTARALIRIGYLTSDGRIAAAGLTWLARFDRQEAA